MDINMHIVINYPELLADPVVVQVGDEEWSCN
jgi:DNA-directed RNA polymerase delta subunit